MLKQASADVGGIGAETESRKYIKHKISKENTCFVTCQHKRIVCLLKMALTYIRVMATELKRNLMVR